MGKGGCKMHSPLTGPSLHTPNLGLIRQNFRGYSCKPKLDPQKGSLRWVIQKISLKNAGNCPSPTGLASFLKEPSKQLDVDLMNTRLLVKEAGLAIPTSHRTDKSKAERIGS